MDWTKIPHTKNLLSKQCEIANVDFNDVDWDSCDWYEKITWTTKNEESFKNWVIDYLKHNRCARKELFTIP